LSQEDQGDNTGSNYFASKSVAARVENTKAKGTNVWRVELLREEERSEMLSHRTAMPRKK